ncbi:MAG: DMT family transporter [Magnetococcales bacterium]|nr:DMT family transporter [Magnetococcales bacterium]
MIASMRVVLAFLLAVFVSGTTPLAIQWSEHGLGLFFTVSVRMTLGLMICLALIWILRIPMLRHDQALRAYLVGGLGFFCGITCSYWGLQLIPSGWSSVLFGLSPMFNGFIARKLLAEPFGWNRVCGSLLGLVGLGLVFFQGIRVDFANNGLGVGIMVVAVVIFSLTTVTMKKIGHQIHPLAITTGSLMVMTPCFFISWYGTQGILPTTIAPRTLGAILYLASFSTVIGFVSMYYLLSRVDASVAALPNLLAPLFGVWLGVVLNGEQVQPVFLAGAFLVLLGLSIFQWGGCLRRKRVGGVDSC